jgi:hypothetical protein
MEQKNKLLQNLEENIFHLVLKRDKMKDNTQKKEYYDLNLHEKVIDIDISYIEHSMNIKLDINNEIINIYNEKFGLKLIDVDIINLIIKYITTCEHIQQIELLDMMGVRAIDYHPKQIVKYLDQQYILSKYIKGYGFGVTNSTLEMFRSIFLNFIIPFSIKYMMKIYCS